MKRYITFIVFLLFIFILSCGPKPSPTAVTISPFTPTPPAASTALATVVPTNTPAPPAAPCVAGPIAYTAIGINLIPCSATPGAIFVINSQAEYNSLCAGNVLTIAGTPTPTPVIIDFNTKTLIGIGIPYYCCESVYLNSLVNITTDCNTITMNWLATPSPGFCNNIICYAICNSMQYYFYLINKTYLPVTQSWTTLSCPTATPTP